MWFEWFICAILFYFECLPWLVGPALSDTVRVGPLGSQVADCGSQMVDKEVHKVKDEVMDMVGDVMNMAKEVATITLAERLTIWSRRWPTASFPKLCKFMSAYLCHFQVVLNISPQNGNQFEILLLILQYCVVCFHNVSNSFVFFQYPNQFSHNKAHILNVFRILVFRSHICCFFLALSVKYFWAGKRRKRSGKINQQIVFLSTLMRTLNLGKCLNRTRRMENILFLA